MKNKIALCFLTYDKLSQPELWSKFIDFEKYNIYIHSKYNFEGEFSNYQIPNKIETKWGHVSLIKATMLLFEEALKLEENKFFILLSDKCIPLYNSDIIYNKIFNYNNNILKTWKNDSDDMIDWFNMRFDYIQKDFFDKNDFYGQSQWMILKRDTVIFFLDNDYTYIYGNEIIVPDETYFVNIMNKFNINYINKQITFVNFEERDNINNPKMYHDLTNEQINKIIKTDSLFMRKVSKDCILPSYFNSINNDIKKEHFTQNKNKINYLFIFIILIFIIFIFIIFIFIKKFYF